MRETKFIEQNREKWQEFETMLSQNHRDPDRLHALFIQITDDLSYARTFYPNRSVRVYLNHLAQQISHKIYRGRRFPLDRLRNFWSDELPQVLYETRKALSWSFWIFMLAFGIGIVSSMIEPEFARSILGDSYVDMTIQNIEKGDPMAVYKEREAFGMTMGIAMNNIWVALLTALLGVFATLGTLYMLLYNGIMVGAFQYFFIEKGLFWESFLTIWIHGTLEISAIVIAGAAGLTAGSGLLFPGTYRRAQAFQLSMRRGIKIFIGLIPVFALAAFFEGFLTRLTDTPDIIRGLFILLSLGLVLWYFVWLPRHKAKLGFKRAAIDKELPADRQHPIQFSEIKSAGEILSDIFSAISAQPRKVLFPILAATACFAIVAFYGSEQEWKDRFLFESAYFGVAKGTADFFGKSDQWGLFLVQLGICTALGMAAFRSLNVLMPTNLQRNMDWKSTLGSALWMAVPTATFLLIYSTRMEGAAWLLIMLFFPFLAIWSFVLYWEKRDAFTGFLRAFNLFKWGNGAILGFLVSSLGIMLFLFFDTQVFQIILEFFSWNIQPESTDIQLYSTVVLTLLAAGVLYFVFWIFLLGGAFTYFSAREIEDATALREAIEEVGAGKQIRGLAKE